MSHPFIPQEPSLEDCWRGIILLGRNVASYKFALAKTLLELKPQSGELVKLSDLAPVFAHQITEHLKLADKQGTSQSSKFLDACRDYNSESISHDKLTDLTVRYGFVNVIDAFHTVGQGEVKKRFYVDERSENDGIRITEEFSELIDRGQSLNLPIETEARWRLVETAWGLGLSANAITIDYDLETEKLFAKDFKLRRKSVTGVRDALSGYQKGRCFYCFGRIQIAPSSPLLPDVDHFFPHKLKQIDFGANLDGVWNLVLACQSCNRGAGGKFENLPKLRLVARLHKRNNFLISSHHPLRETLMLQTGADERKRRDFLNTRWNKANSSLSEWEPEEEGEPYF